MRGTKPSVKRGVGGINGNGAPPMPEGLSDEMIDVWSQLVEDMVSSGLADVTDWPLVEIAAVRIARMREARRMIDAEGMTTTSTKGTVMIHPAVRIEREASAEVRQLLDALGIGPVGRARLGKMGVRRTMSAEFDRTVGPLGRRSVLDEMLAMREEE